MHLLVSPHHPYSLRYSGTVVAYGKLFVCFAFVSNVNTYSLKFSVLPGKHMVISAKSSVKPLPKFKWGLAGFFLKQFAERLRVLEAQFISNLANGQAGYG